MSSGCVRALALAIAVLLPLSGARACEGDKVLFHETFEFADPAWSWSDKAKVGDGKVVIRAPINKSHWVWNSAFAFDDIDVCYKITLTEPSSDPTDSYGGLMFWVIDSNNYFSLHTSSNGYFKVARRLDGKWTVDPIRWTKTDLLKQGPKETNTVRLRLQGQVVTVMLNGKEATKFRAQAPGRASAIGLLSSSAPKSEDPWSFTDLKVTNVK